MNKVLKIIFICLVVAGACLAAFTDVPIAEYSGIALAFAGAAMACITTWNKSEKKDWKVVVSIILIAVGAFALGFAGVAGDAISKIIAAVGGVVLLIFGIIASIKLENK